MPKFSYRAITETGATTTGEIEAETADKASSLLASQGYIPTRVKEERVPLPVFNWEAHLIFYLRSRRRS